MGDVINFKFGAPFDRQAYKPENAKLGQKWHGLRHVTYFYNFCTLTTSMEWLSEQTSNLVHYKRYYSKMQK